MLFDFDRLASVPLQYFIQVSGAVVREWRALGLDEFTSYFEKGALTIRCSSAKTSAAKDVVDSEKCPPGNLERHLPPDRAQKQAPFILFLRGHEDQP